MSCEHCIQGVRHEGTPEGTYADIAGVKCYIATPSGEYDKSKVFVFLCDAFGLELENNLLLCDAFARNGYKVVAPDLFEGDAVSVETLENPELRAKFDFLTWLPRHSPEHNFTRVKGVLDALKSEGVTRFASVGYCYGARIAIDLVFAGELHVVAMAHPSMLAVEDLEKYASTATAPLLINACEVDNQFGPDMQSKATEVFKDFKHGFEMPYFDGCTHGFAVRGDMSDPKVKAGKEGAFKKTVEWLQKYL